MLINSQKTGADKYDVTTAKGGDDEKTFPRLDARILAETFQYLFEATRGYAIAGNEGKGTAQTADAVITVNNLATYRDYLTKALMTLITFGGHLDVDGSSSANAIVLTSSKIDNQSVGNANFNANLSTPLPYTFRNNLEFRFKANATNTSAVTVNILNFDGLAGGRSLVNEDGSVLSAGQITTGNYYDIICDKTNNRFILKNSRVIRTDSNGLIPRANIPTTLCTAYLTAQTSISSTPTILPLTQEQAVGNISCVGNNFIIQESGYYKMTGWVISDGNLGGVNSATVQLYKNGNAYDNRYIGMFDRITTSGSERLTMSGEHIVQLSAGNTISFRAYNDGTTNQTIATPSFFSVLKISEI